MLSSTVFVKTGGKPQKKKPYHKNCLVCNLKTEKTARNFPQCSAFFEIHEVTIFQKLQENHLQKNSSQMLSSTVFVKNSWETTKKKTLP